jgi:starch phosphorylase
MDSYAIRWLPDSLTGLLTLALDLRWSWHHGSDELWRALDAETWEATRNAWLVLNSVPGETLEKLGADPAFQQLYQEQVKCHQEFLVEPTWYSETCPGSLEQGIAYFCMEFGISESLPLYSGGLGVLAGDYLKAASDLGIPVTAVGLLYQQGYFRQAIGSNGEQLEFYPYNDPTILPVTPLRDESGEWLRVTVPFPGRLVRLRAWTASVGRCRLLLLDSNDPRNEPGDRGITSELYTGDSEKRLQQEMVLGIGGMKLLRQAGIPHSVCHINEGHSALALVERALQWQHVHGSDFATARMATRPTNLFTTHTPVASGFDIFPLELIRLYLSPWLKGRGVSDLQLAALSQRDQGDPEHLNMGWLALAMSGRVNGVSAIHQTVSRHIFQPLFPRWPTEDIPVEYVTNGVHTPSWDSPQSDAVWTGACGKERWRWAMPDTTPINCVSDSELWEMRRQQRARLIHYLRRRLASQHCEQQLENNPDAACGLLLDAETLTLGFARRFTEYKRPDLLLREPQRLMALLNDRDRPLQIIIAGKAHPQDHKGKQLIRQWQQFIRQPGVEGRIIFIEDYDLGVAAQFVQGVDVWLNTPRHPWEACGTSGMKVLVNGGLNLSQYDGWWGEAWHPDLGWAIRPGATLSELSRTAEHDPTDARELYELLEKEVIPEFYRVDQQALPKEWLRKVRASMNRLTALYSANRMVREYVEAFYQPMINNGKLRTPETAHALANQQTAIQTHWPRLRFSAFGCTRQRDTQLFTLEVYLDGLQQALVAAELVAEESEYGPRIVHPMTMKESLPGSANGFLYECEVPARPEGHYTPRLRVEDPRLNLPLEDASILWLR